MKKKKIVLAEGEHTGHKHVLTALDSAFIHAIQDLNKNFKFKSGAKTALTHEEHAPELFLPNIEYKQNQKREVDPFTEEIRMVRD